MTHGTLALTSLLLIASITTILAKNHTASSGRKPLTCPDESTISNCRCTYLGGIAMFCPESNPKLEISVSEYTLATFLACQDQYDLDNVPNLEIGNISHLVVNSCALNETQSILETFDFLGVTNVKELRYQNYVDLQRFPYNSKHFEGLKNLVGLTLIRGFGVQKDTFEHLSNLQWLNIQSHKLELQRGVFDGLPNLEVLSLEDNNIDRLDDGLFKYNRNLQKLSLAHNNILYIGKEAFKGLNNLRMLNLKNSNISSLDPDLFSFLPELTELDIEGNSISSFPEGMLSGNLKLKTFSLGYNQNSLEILPENFLANLPQLKTVDLKHSKISHLPDSLFHQSTQIVELNLANNRLKSIPEILLRDQHQVRDLYLDDNLLENLPDELLENTKELSTLCLSNNRLQSLSGKVFGNLINLKKLRLENNRLQTIDHYTFSGTKGLKELYLQNNQLAFQRKHYKNILNITKEVLNGLNNLGVLNLAHNRIRSIPEKLLSDQHQLRDLNLHHNLLEQIPDELLENSRKLTTLRLSNNHLQSLSGKVFGNLINLKKLCLENNRLQTIDHYTFSGNKGLQELYLQNNQLAFQLKQYKNIHNISKEVFNGLTNLRLLNLANNTLKSIPEMLLSNQHQLLELNLNHNLLKKIPDELLKYTRKLNTLRLANNRLQSLSGNVFCNLMNLKILCLENNRLQTIDHYTFSENRRLEELNMQNNQLAFHATSFVYYEQNIGPFESLKKLRTLTLQNNRISTIFMDWNIKTLKYLDLSNNQITKLHYANLQFKNNIYVNLTNNNISLVSIDIEQVKIRKNNKINVDLSNNPLDCNCNALGFVEYTQDKRLKALQFKIDRLRCAEPRNLRGTSIKEVKAKDLKCMLDKCPDESTIPNCTCHDGEAQFEFYCPELNSMVDIKVQKSIQSANLTCREQYDLDSVPNLEIGNIGLLVVNSCVLNETQSILETFDFLGVTNVRDLRYHDYYELQRFPYNSKNFEGLENLVNLTLKCGFGIQQNTFEHLSNLKRLNIQSNKLELQRGVFDGMPNLEVLRLEYNKIDRLDEGLFNRNRNLQVLALAHNNILNIHKEVFNGLNNLRVLDLRNNDDPSLGMHSEHLKLEAFGLRDNMNSLESLPENFLANLPLLKSVNLNDNKISYITDSLFNQSTEIVELNLANNCLRSIPEKLLSDQHQLRDLNLHHNLVEKIPDELLENSRKLTTLRLSNNHLKSLSGKEVFNGLSKLHVLNLRNNNISSLKPNLFPWLSALTELDIGANPISRFPEGMLSGNLKLEVFGLSVNKNTLVTLPENFLANLPQLRTVNLDHSKISHLPDSLLYQSTEIVELNLANNSLRSIPGMLLIDQHQLRDLNLDHNLLEKIPDELLEYTRKVTTLRLSNNHLQSLSGTVFRNLKNLKKLHLENNRLKTIDHYTFRGNGGLEELYLQNNQLAFHANTPFRYLGKLRTLKLQHNRISTIFMDRNINTQNLQDLDLSNNQISQLQFPNLQFQKDISMNLSNNNISLVDIDIKQLKMREKKINVDLSNNPLDCNCKILDFVRYVQNDSLKAPQFNTSRLRCTGPENLRHTSVTEVKTKDLKCMLNKNCPGECSCDLRPLDYTIVVNCSGRNLPLIPELPQPNQFNGYHSIELHIDHNRLIKLPTSNLSGYDQVTQLHVRNNSIRRLLSENIPNKLSFLDVSQNQLQTIDDSTVEFLNQASIISSIKLSNNPWSCSCKTSRLLKFIQSNQHRIKDMSEIRCNGKDPPLEFITANDLCNDNLTTVICITIAVMGLTVGLLSTLFYRYQTELKVWLFTHNLLLWLITEEEMDRDKQYDAFISYSHLDEDFITEQLVPTLEKEPMNFKTCWHVRDFMPGEMIITQIIKSIEASRRTVIVLSKNFLQSHWAKEEFRTAHVQSMEDNRVRVIVIIYGDIGDVDKLDPELKAYLKTNTYVKWGDPWFWDKLQYAMPHPLKIKGLKKDIPLEQMNATAPKTV